MKNLSWRKYDSDTDMDAVLLLHIETEETVGGAMDLPNLDGRPVLECWVVEKDGVIIGGYYMEDVAEFVMFGRDPEATAFLEKHTKEIAQRLRERGLRICRTIVPNWIGHDVESIREELEDAGFHSTDEHYCHFIYHLRGRTRVVPEPVQELAAVQRCVE